MRNVYKTIQKLSKMNFGIHTKWYLLICYYMVARVFFGLSYTMIYGFIAILFFLGISLEQIIMIFLCNSIIAYIFSSLVEANQYLSFVWGFMVCIIFREAFSMIIEKQKSSK